MGTKNLLINSHAHNNLTTCVGVSGCKLRCKRASRDQVRSVPGLRPHRKVFPDASALVTYVHPDSTSCPPSVHRDETGVSQRGLLWGPLSLVGGRSSSRNSGYETLLHSRIPVGEPGVPFRDSYLTSRQPSSVPGVGSTKPSCRFRFAGGTTT